MALAAFGALAWAGLVVDPQYARALLAVGAMAAGAAAIGGRPDDRARPGQATL